MKKKIENEQQQQQRKKWMNGIEMNQYLLYINQ